MNKMKLIVGMILSLLVAAQVIAEQTVEPGEEIISKVCSAIT